MTQPSADMLKWILCTDVHRGRNLVGLHVTAFVQETEHDLHEQALLYLWTKRALRNNQDQMTPTCNL